MNFRRLFSGRAISCSGFSVPYALQMMAMQIGYVQTSPVFGEKNKNFDQAAGLLSGITADLIVLPELFATGYAFTSKEEAATLAEEKGRGETFRFLRDISAQTGSAIVAGFVERENDRIYNSAMMVYEGKLIGIYRKIHLFNKEKLWFTPGDQPFRVFGIKGARIGMMICFDWIFPEACRSLTLQGAQVIAHPSNLVLPYAQKAMVTRCLENRVFAVTANRIGTETRGPDDFTFTGGSQITSVDGTILSSAPEDKPWTDFVGIDAGKANAKKINDYNDVIGDRRPGFYQA